MYSAPSRRAAALPRWACRAPPWLCLFGVSSFAAYGMQAGIASLVASASLVSTPPVTPAPGSVITITAWKSTDGESQEVVYVTPGGLTAADMLMVLPGELRQVVANVCQGVP